MHGVQVVRQWGWLFTALLPVVGAKPNSTYTNPILPGFHPDPSCVFVPDWDDTFFCASSSFNAFPGIPLHASKDLQNWKLIGHVLNRKEQLPRLAETNRSTSGIWAPTLRYNEKTETFWLVTTLVDDDRPDNDTSRWDNARCAFSLDRLAGFSVHFDFQGYDTSPIWDVDGKTYIVGGHAWRVAPGIMLAEADLDTGNAPEGPHIYRKDGWYYLLAAEGGTGLNHMVTMARSRNLYGPYKANPVNPVLSNANTTEYWPEYLNFPMGRETIMVPVTWETGEFPLWSPVRGVVSGWPMPKTNKRIPGLGPFTTDGDIINFQSGSTLPAHFTFWRYPLASSYIISPDEKPNTLRLAPSKLNLTAINGNYAGSEGQTFVGRRQQDTLFTFSVDLDFSPGYSEIEAEAGVSVFLTQNHHLDLGVVMLPPTAAIDNFLGDIFTDIDTENSTALVPYFRFRGISYIPVPEDFIVPIPKAWRETTLRLEIRASNVTHYAFSAGPAESISRMRTLLEVSNEPVSWGFTGVILGVYCTSNGHNGTTPAYFSRWRYAPQGQFRD
ncbi:hypothetical protein FHL15_006990 [Xylaria flabelliformis]|uniref:Beta-xylosidase C-terminal Concanavalin A-like domain-containing protein n=1 Tax=Xylaria flabelliformis TaxID=2512241 RepID=A0A553HW12_9PEZI|nr:hypothetical protein FHL15_006990 [Xylaria flabelliformis]